VPSLLDKCYGNLRAGHDKFALYEMNQVYPKNLGVDNDKVPVGSHELGFVFVDQAGQSNYYIAKKYLASLLAALGIDFALASFEKTETNTYYEPKRSATIKVGDQTIGFIGEIQGKVLRGFKLPRGVAAFELKLADLLIDEKGVASRDYRISNYPSVSRDLTITVAPTVAYADIESKIRAVLDGFIYKLRPTSIYQAEGSETKNLSFHLEFAAPDKTLTKAEISDIMEKLESIK
jgi:phenylalanyl-tRNA synthetase beta chain